jgi:hypothetical protein
MLSMLSNPKYWTLKAEEARVTAEAMTDPDARKMMFEIAEQYETIARRTAILADVAISKKP